MIILIPRGILVLLNALRKKKTTKFHKIKSLDSSIIRFINSLGPRSSVTADTLGEFNLLYVETQVMQLRLNHVHIFFYDLCPTYLKKTFVPLKDVHQYCTRFSHFNFLVPHCQNLDKSTFTYAEIADWNSLPECLKVSKGAKIRNRYNQVPHLTQDTNGKETNSHLDTTNESQEVSPFPAGDHKAHINRRAQRHSKHKTEKT